MVCSCDNDNGVIYLRVDDVLLYRSVCHMSRGVRLQRLRVRILLPFCVLCALLMCLCVVSLHLAYGDLHILSFRTRLQAKATADSVATREQTRSLQVEKVRMRLYRCQE